MTPSLVLARSGLRRRAAAICMISLSLACALNSVQAQSSALSRLPDETVRSLRDGFVERTPSAHFALTKKLEEIAAASRKEDELLHGEVGEPSHGMLRARKGRFASHRAELKVLAEQYAREIESARSLAIDPAGDRERKLKDRDPLKALSEGIADRFERIDGLLSRVDRSRSQQERRSALRDLRALIKTLQPTEPVVGAGAPMFSVATPTTKAPGSGGQSRALPAYAMDMLREEPMRFASSDPFGEGGFGGNGVGFVKVGLTLPPVSPNAATECSSTAADLADDGVEVRLTPEIHALAKELQYSPTKILRWMLKEVEFDPYWGSLKGAVGTLQTRRGNATDQSSLLIALLRASNVPARYVRGAVSVLDRQPSDNASGRMQRWLGTKNYSASRLALSLGGIPAEHYVNKSGEVNGIAFDHVWVQACVPYVAYRGSRSNAGGYRWLPIDPSIKDRGYQEGLSVNVNLDSGFFSSYLTNRTDDLLLDRLADRVLLQARAIKSDAAIQDVPYRGELRDLKVDVLPSNTPAAVVQFTNWTGSSSPETSALPDAHRYKFSVVVKSGTGSTLVSQVLTFPQNIFSKISVSYQPDLASQSLWNSWGGALSGLPSGSVNVFPVIKVDGGLVASGSAAATIPLGAAHKVIMKLTQSERDSNPSCVSDSGVSTDTKDPDRTCLNKTAYTNLRAGGYYALGVNAGQVSETHLAQLTSQLTAGVNSNVTPPTPSSGSAYEATVGQLLHLVLQSYNKSLQDGYVEASALMGFRSLPSFDIGLTGSDLKTEYAFDLPLTVKPSGLFVDFKGGRLNAIKLATSAPLTPNQGETLAAYDGRVNAELRSERRDLYKVMIYSASGMEHQVWQQALRVDAVSTVRGLQFASESGIPLITLTSSNIGQYDSLMDASMSSYKSAITAEVDAGATVTVPRAKLAYPDQYDPSKIWRGAVYFSFNESRQHYGASIEGGFSGGYALFYPTPLYSLYTPSTFTPSFETTDFSNISLLTTLVPGIQGSNGFATWVGDPVNMLTGNFSHHETDFRIKGRGGFPIVLERWYNSGEPADGPFGHGWTHSFNHQIKLYGVEGTPSKAKVSWVNGSGGEQYFSTTSHSAGDIAKGTVLTNPAGTEVQFSRVSGGADDGKFRIRERDGTVYLFASATGPNVVPSATSAVTARLLSITDRSGNALTLNYTGSQLTSVTDSLGRSVLTFSWTNNHVTQVSDFSGRKVIYAYTDGNGNLNQVTDALSQVHKYSYYTTADGAKLNHRIKRHTLPRGNGMEFAYYSGGQVFKHTPFGTDGDLIDASATTFHYNLFNRESWSVNGRGHEHRITFDTHGNPVKIVKEDGAVHTFTYDSANPHNRLTETDSIGRVTQYTYTTGTQKNLVETITRPSGAVVEYRDYNSHGLPQRIKDERGNWTWQKFDATGNLTDVIRVKSGVVPVAGTQPAAANILAWTKMSYDTVGNVVTVTRVKDFSAGTGPSVTQNWDPSKLNVLSLNRKGNRNGSIVNETTASFSHDALGRRKTGVDERWYANQFEYDALDRVILSTNPHGKTVKFSFDANGNPKGTELLDAGVRWDASSASFDDQDRVIDTLDHAGNRSFFLYDEVGNRLAQTSPDNFTLGFDYDAMNRPTSAYDAEENQVRTSLDTEGRPTSVTDPNGNEVVYEYWGKSGASFLADGRVKRVTQPALPGQAAGRAVEYDYDNAGNVIRSRTVAGDGSSSRQRHAFYDELGRVSRTVDAPDDSGNRLQLCNKYDSLGNLTEIWAGPTTDVTTTACSFNEAGLKKQAAYTWDDFGNQLSRTDQLGKVWAFAYDYHGNLESSQTPEQAKVSATTKTTYSYFTDLNGLLKSKFVPGSGANGVTVSYERNPLGQVTRAETKDGNGTQVVAYDYTYDTAHRLSNIADNRSNKALSYEWTPGGRLSKVLLKDAGVVSHQWDYKYDAVGRPVAIVAPNGQTVTFSLDASGRMIERTVGTGLVTQYDLHPDGSLKRVAHMAQALSSGTQLGNVQSALLAEHAYTYDIWGNRSTSTDTLSGQTYAKTYGYDALNRIKSVSNGNAAQLETYSFDIFDNLKTKSLGSPVAQSWTYSVDDAHQLKQVQQTVGGTATTALLRYDDNGNLKKLCEGTGLTGTTTDCSGSATTSFTWNGLNELVALAKAGTTVLSEAYAYDDAGRRVRKTSAGVTSHYMLDGADIVAEWSGAAITGAPTAAYVHGGATDDPVLRLTGASGTPQAVSHAFAQDGIGNVTALLSMGAEPANQMRVAGNTLTSTGDYDATTYPVGKTNDGITAVNNLEGWVAEVSNGAALTLSFAAPTALERIEVYAVSFVGGGFRPSAFVVEVQEGSSGWRQVASGGLSDFVHYEADVISSTDWAATFRAIKSFPAVSASAVRIRFTATEDTQYGLVWLTEVQAWSTNNSTTQRYDAWGSVAGSASIPMYGFTGREADASGLMYNRARYYSPKYGRFISRDPIGFQGGFNPYAYAANNPVNATDPSGLLPVSPLITSGPSNYYGNGIQVADASPGGVLQILSDARATVQGWSAGAGPALDVLMYPTATRESPAFQAGYEARKSADPYIGTVRAVLGALGLGSDAAPGLPSFASSASLLLGRGTAVASGTVGELRAAGLKDAHHIIQDAAVRNLPGYGTNAAPGIVLQGPSTLAGSAHNLATAVQRQAGGGTFAAERRIGYKALRSAGISVEDARAAISRVDEYFGSIGVGPDTITRIPGNR